MLRSRIIIIINNNKLVSWVLGYGTKIIILLFWFRVLLFWFRAGDGRAEYPFPSASTLPMHAQSARAAVRAPGAVQFALGEQGRRS